MKTSISHDLEVLKTRPVNVVLFSGHPLVVKTQCPPAQTSSGLTPTSSGDELVTSPLLEVRFTVLPGKELINALGHEAR